MNNFAISLPANVQRARQLRENAKHIFFDKHDELHATKLLEEAARLLNLNPERNDHGEWHDFHSLLEEVGAVIWAINARELEKLIEIQCLLCSEKVMPSEYLHKVFASNKNAEIAANLVTHYRHEHINYYDAACQNGHYARKIPGYSKYGHSAFKQKVNNYAKRKMMKALADNKQEGWRDIIAAFSYLQSNDEKMEKLIAKYVQVPSSTHQVTAIPDGIAKQ